MVEPTYEYIRGEGWVVVSNGISRRLLRTGFAPLTFTIRKPELHERYRYFVKGESPWHENPDTFLSNLCDCVTTRGWHHNDFFKRESPQHKFLSDKHHVYVTVTLD